MRISDWSSDVCSSDLGRAVEAVVQAAQNARRVALAELFLDAGSLIPLVKIGCEQVDRRVRRRFPTQRAAHRIKVTVVDAGIEEGVLGIAVAVQIDAGDATGRGVTQRSEERRVGKECVSTCRSRW